MKITKLTSMQKEKLKEYKDKWVKIGLSTERFNKEDIRQDIDDLYTNILKRKKVPIFVFDNPVLAWYATCIIYAKNKMKKDRKNIISEVRNEVENEVWKKVRNEVENEVWNEVRNEVENEVEKEVMNEVGKKVRNEVGNEVWKEVGNEVWKKVENEVWKEVWKEVGNEVENEVRKKVRNEVENEVWKKVRNEVGKEVWNEVGNEVWKKVENEVGKKVENEVWNEIGIIRNICLPYLYGSFDAWYSFYNYFDIECFKFKKSKEFNIIKKMSNLGFIWACRDFCIISQKPSVILKNENGLHAEGKPALEYAGKPDIKVYYLNGVRVPKYLAVTSAEKLSLDFFRQEKNADVKAEFIRKYGLDRMVSLGKQIDTYKNYNTEEWWVKSEYELIDMSPIFESIDYAPHLLMRNQTIKDLYHLEGVDPKCKTLKDAIEWRENIKLNKYKTISIK